MEQDTKTDNTGSSSEDRSLARRLLDAWTKPPVNEDIQGRGEVDGGRGVFSMGNLTGGGFAFPGPRCGVVTVPQNGEEHEEDHRNASFNDASKADES